MKIVDVWCVDRTNRSRLVSIMTPFRLITLDTGAPRLRHKAISPRVAQLESRSAAVGVGGPRMAVEIMHFVRGMAEIVDQHNSPGTMRKLAVEISDNRDIRIFPRQAFASCRAN